MLRGTVGSVIATRSNLSSQLHDRLVRLHHIGARVEALLALSTRTLPYARSSRNRFSYNLQNFARLAGRGNRRSVSPVFMATSPVTSKEDVSPRRASDPLQVAMPLLPCVFKWQMQCHFVNALVIRHTCCLIWVRHVGAGVHDCGRWTCW